ncbi:MAG: NUDIX hydrolase [Chloroflexi bacterium]|nr:NUDIX hydrolase [Chloroflexota bacterium]
MKTHQVFFAYDRNQPNPSQDYRYCPLCGSELQATDQNGNRKCTRCGFVRYKNPFPGVTVLIEKENQVLLGKRQPSSFQGGKWCLPGGFIEYDEDFISAGRREVEEETGLRVSIESILSVMTNYLAPHLHTLVVTMLAHVDSGSAQPGDDIAELGWFPLAGPLPDMAFEADRHIIERYYATRVTGAPIDLDYAG